jgi:Calcium/calmodulin dependent protein kinase II association domain
VGEGEHFPAFRAGSGGGGSGAGRQGSTRVYANDTVVVQNAYFVLTLTDKSGNVSVHNIRGSMTWLKMDNQWRIVDQHVSEANGADRS